MKRTMRPIVPATSPAGLLNAAMAYASWAEANPIVQRKRMPNGEVVEYLHDRALTFEGFIVHADLDPLALERLHADAPQVYAAIRALFFDQQYARAAVGLYDRRLVAAYFGLAERRQVEATVTVANLSDADLDAELSELMTLLHAPQVPLPGPKAGNESLECPLSESESDENG